MVLGSLLGASFGLGLVLFIFNLGIDFLRHAYTRVADGLNLDPTFLGWVVLGSAAGGVVLKIGRAHV